MQTYDLIVIGSGPAGPARRHSGRQIREARGCWSNSAKCVGGACINTGTIPSKTMREAVLHLSGYQYQGIYGVNYRVKEKITMADLAFRVQHVIKTEIDVTQAQLTRNGVEVLTGTASFVDPTHVRVDELAGAERTCKAPTIIIATGTKPAVSPEVPLNGRNIINSDQILQMPEIPKTLIVVGGGVIGVEYTCMFATLGVRVILVEKRPRLLEFADAEMVEALSYHLRDHRVTMRLNEEVASVEETAGRRRGGESGEQEEDLRRRAALRRGPAGQRRRAEPGRPRASKPTSAGASRWMPSTAPSQPHIYAAGDVIGFPSLASVSMEQGRIAAAHAFGLNLHSNPATYPYGIYTIPEISFIGKTEEQLTDEDVPYEVGVAYYREIARGQIRGDTTGRLKIIFHRETHEILGVHIIGEGASELLHIGQAVMILKGTVEYFVDTVFNYPTLAECYKAAAFNGLNKLARL